MRADRAVCVDALGTEWRRGDGESAATLQVCDRICRKLSGLPITAVDATRLAAALRQTSGKLASAILAWGSICFFRGGGMANRTTAAARDAVKSRTNCRREAARR
jgi:hypothetical protein